MEQTYICVLCKKQQTGIGNNLYPMFNDRPRIRNKHCCDDCNIKFVIPMRFEVMKEKQNKDDSKQ